MSLRVKVELVLFVVVGLVVGLTYGIQRFLILPGLDPLEEEVALKDLDASTELLDAQRALLDDRCSSWAVQSALSDFVLQKNDAYTDSYLEDTMTTENLNLIYIVNAYGEVKWGRTIDLETGQSLEVEELPPVFWPPDSHPLIDRPAPGAAISGIFMSTTLGPTVVASHVIPRPGNSGAPLGSLVLGRFLDERLRDEIHTRSPIPFRIWDVNDPNLGEDERNALGLAKGSIEPVKITSEDRIRAYAIYHDIHNEPALLLRVDVYRNILAKFYEAMQRGLLVQVGIGLTALVILIVLFRRSVMNPLTRLTVHTVGIGESNDLSARLEMHRGDEIGSLADEFDGMVSKLETDLEERKRQEDALRESEERYALAVRGANDGLWDWDLNVDKIHFSPRWKSMLGYEEEDITDSPDGWIELIHTDDQENVRAALDAHLTGQSAHFESEHRIRHKANNFLWVLCRGLAIRDKNESATRMAGSQTDITLRKLVEEQLSHQALHDSLTTLPNRALFLDRLGQALKHSQRHKDYMFAVLFLDLDRFKVINDGLGHVIGDILLKAFGERLATSLRDGDTVARGGGTVARFGGDEFVLLLDNLNDVTDATIIAERIQELLKEPFRIEGNEVYTTVSIGIAVSAEGYNAPEEFVRNADTAMYRAKAQGKARFAIFDTDMHEKAIARLELENDLRRAVDNEEFSVVYQPIIDLTTGKINALEALIRWKHPERGWVSPDEFIPVAEETGMIVPIGEFVARTACRQTRAWQITIRSAENLSISVNLSVKEFSKPNLFGQMRDMLVETGLDPRHLKIEITESAIMESIDFVTRTLKQLREMNIQLSIDDFGTGYSSLSYLHRFPMNNLKIDQAFIRDMMTTHESEQIVKTIVLLAKALEMDVIAEGIEEEVQRDLLRGIMCEYGQGYLFSKPLTAPDMEELLKKDPCWIEEDVVVEAEAVED